MLSQLPSGTPSDVLGLAVSEIHDHTLRVCPIIVDEKIHYSVMKMLYSFLYHEYNVGHKLCRTPPVFGIRHPYKNTITITYHLFFPLMVASSHGSVAVYTPHLYVPLIFMEGMFACLFVAPF